MNKEEPRWQFSLATLAAWSLIIGLLLWNMTRLSAGRGRYYETAEFRGFPFDWHYVERAPIDSKVAPPGSTINESSRAVLVVDVVVNLALSIIIVMCLNLGIRRIRQRFSRKPEC